MKWLLLIPVLVVVFIISLSIYLQPNDFLGCASTPDESVKCQKADAIVVVSGGNTATRTQAGIDLYKNGWADSLIFSGAAQDVTGPSNAAAMKAQALESGIPDAAIYIDEAARTTQENAANTRSLFEQYDVKNVILVTSGYHQRRASLEFEKQAGTITIMNHPATGDDDWSFWWWATPRGWWLAGGELVKIVAFYTQGEVK